MIKKRDHEKQKERESNNRPKDDDIPVEADELERLEKIIENQEAQNSDPPVSLYQIIKEIAEEEGQPFISDGRITDLDAFDSYRTKQRRNFKKVMEKLDFLDKFRGQKGDDYQIPQKDKEYIKLLVRNFAQPLNRKIRQGREETITPEEIKSFYEEARNTGFLKATEEDRAKKLDLIASLTKVSSQEALKAVIPSMRGMLERDLGTLTFVSGKKESLRLYNDSDAAYMIYLYEDLMQQQSRVWNRIVDIVEELRDFETSEAIEDEHGEYPFRNIHELLTEALEILSEERKRN